MSERPSGGTVERRDLDDLQPSQLLVSAEKLRDVLAWWDADDPDPEPIPYLDPVADLDLDPGVGGGEGVPRGTAVVPSDGHTRLLAAALTGAETVPVVRDPDRDDLSLGVYRECVGWCVEADVRTPADLVGRVVTHERFLDDWVGRCHALGDE